MRSHEQRDQTILVIEPDTALRRIMALGLRQRGFQVIETRSLGAAWDVVTSPPAAVVLDISLGPNSEWMVLRTLRSHRLLGASPLVLLAWDCPTDASLAGASTAPCVCLSKPFDARLLFEAVETVLVAPAGVLVHAVAEQEGAAAQALSRATSAMSAEECAAEGIAEGADGHTAPTASIWPLVTAAGATLAVAGFLIHPAVVILGSVIIFAALLLWLGETISLAPSACTRASGNRPI
jgi:CheY-like chemotaxis protein